MGIFNKTLFRMLRQLDEMKMSFQMNRPPDASVLKPGIPTTVTGLRQAILALQSATLEVKRYMLDEACIIYECKTCHNMFRSLANLIAHKRSFCRNKYAEVDHIYTDKTGKDVSFSQKVYIENEKFETVVPDEVFDLDQYAPSFDLLNEAKILQEIKSVPIVDRLLPPKKASIEKVVDRLTTAKMAPVLPTDSFTNPTTTTVKNEFMLLEPIIENTSAVFQTLGQFKTIANDYRELKKNNIETTVVAPSGIAMSKGPLLEYTNPASPCSPDSSKENKDVGMHWKYTCPICKKVTLVKMNQMFKHIERKHGKTREDAVRMKKIIRAGRKLIKKEIKNKMTSTSSWNSADDDDDDEVSFNLDT